MIKQFSLAVIAAVSFSGCASIVSDSAYPVTINSSPDGAAFSVVNTSSGMTVMRGTTPSTVTLKASDGFFDGADYTLNFQKEGYSNHSYPLSSSVDGWYVANILFGGLIGLLIIDPATGAMWKLGDGVGVSLTKDAQAESDTLSVTTLDQVSEAARAEMVRVN